MINRGKLENIIQHSLENEEVDFKATHYKDKSALLKDIISFANSKSFDTKYIITGIKAERNGKKSFIGINENIVKDSADYQQLVWSNIEPRMNIDYYSLEYQDRLFEVFEISGADDKPYMLKKDYQDLKIGQSWIRRGSTNSNVTRADLDDMYLSKEKLVLYINRDILYATREDGLCEIDISIQNDSTKSNTILSGIMEVIDNENNVVSVHEFFGFEDKIIGADFKLTFSPHEEKSGIAYFSVTSTDCLRWGMDSDGFVNNFYRVKITLLDSKKNEFVYLSERISILARGKILWKCKMKR